MHRRLFGSTLQRGLSTASSRHDELLNLRNFSNITPHLEKEIHIYSNKKEIPVSLKSLMETGKGDKLNRFDELVKGKYSPQTAIQPQASQKILIQVACFLHRELPVRLAHRATRLESSPLFVKSSTLACILFIIAMLFIYLQSR